jgi:hypothetical protein
MSLLKFLTGKLPIAYLLSVPACGLLASVFIHGNRHKNSSADTHHAQTGEYTPVAQGLDMNSKMIRLNNWNLTKPLIIGEEAKPADNLSLLKETLNKFIIQGKKMNLMHNASVYINDLDYGCWISVNDDEKYHPGSLMKVAVMIAYLKNAEDHPGLLEKTLVLDENIRVARQSYSNDSILPSVPYTISNLLKYMIVHSDNYATMLLNENIDKKYYSAVFSDLGLAISDRNDMDYCVSASDYSRLINILYNGNYLNNHNSEFALTLLSQSTFKNGLLLRLPAGVTVAHKFGEKTYNNEHELHESGIVYCGKHPYLITIMTKGENVSNLGVAISKISKQVFDYFCN